MNFPAFELPMNLKTIWVETVDFLSIRNDVTKEVHAHSFLEVHFLFSGTVTYRWDETYFEVCSGQAFLIPAQKEHKYISCSDDVLKTTIAFSCDSALFAEAKIFAFDDDIARNFDKMFEMCEQNNVFTPYVISGKAMEILYTVLQSVSSKLPEFTAAKHDPRFLVAKEFIENNFDKRITCSHVANECCLSVKQLNRIFCKETGESISNYINAVKTKYAKKILLESNLSVKEISFMVGFENEGSFISFFKKHCAATPAVFRKQMSEK